MKTSLVIDDRVFEDAKKEANRTGKSVSEIISSWAATGRDHWRTKSSQKVDFKPANLGSPKIDITSRKAWMETLDDDES